MALDIPTGLKKNTLGTLMKLQELTKEVQASQQLKLTSIFAYSSREQLAKEVRGGT